MKISDRIRAGVRAFGEATPSTPRKTRPKTNAAEVGVSGDFNILYDREEKRLDDVSIQDLRRMRLNDGTVSAMYNLMTWPIKAAEHYVRPAEGGEAEAEFIERTLVKPPRGGGMSYPFTLLIGDILRSTEDGFRLYEKVWTVNERGELVYKKVAPRAADTVTLLRDKNGGFAGARQKTWTGSNYVDVTIPVDRCFLFTYAKERNYLYGESPLRSAYSHYDRKHKLYFLQELAGQAGAISPRVLSAPASVFNDAEKLAEAEASADNFGYQQRITLPEGWNLEAFRSYPIDLQPAIDHHDTLIARSALMQFLVLAGNKTGSYGQSKNDSDLFILALTGVMAQIEDHINTYLIPQLIDYNFASGRYPEFKFEEMDNETRSLLKEAFTTILTRDDVPSYVIEGIMKQVADQLGIEQEASKDLSDKTSDRELADTSAQVRSKKRETAAKLSKKLDAAIAESAGVASEELLRLKDDALKRVEKLLKSKDFDKLKDFELGDFGRYRKLLEEAMMAQYLVGKRSAADEGGIGIPSTPKTSRTYIVEQARAIADKQAEDLRFIVKSEVTKELRTQTLSERSLGFLDVLAAISASWTAFVQDRAVLGVDIALTGALTLGRSDSFTTDNNIAAYELSAILDGRTSPICKPLAKSPPVLTPEQYRASRYVPPFHFKCRSMWVAYYKDDSFIPALNPFPAGFTGRSLSDIATVQDAA